MKETIQARCIICQLLFCCQDCRWNHEQLKHGLTYDCPICRGNRFLCRKEELNTDFLNHLVAEHAPLQCKKCNKIFESMEDFNEIDKCTSISELIEKPEPLKQEVEERFDSIYEKIVDNDCDNLEAIVSVNNSTKTAVITPIVRKKNIVDYECSDSESEEASRINITTTPHPGKTPKLKKQRIATPHAKKFMGLMRQQIVEENAEGDDEMCADSPDSTRFTPGRKDIGATDTGKDMKTPAIMTPHMMKLAQIVTTSTPTHPLNGNWSLFPAAGTDSPLSEIETTESPAQSIDKDQDKPEESQPKLKSIIADGKRLGSQDSTERQVTFQDTENTDSSAKIKRVTFANDTKFGQECKMKRVFRKPKRMLTPGPQKRYNNNPRFQALINRFEHQARTLARTPINKELKEAKELENTPPTGEHNIPARAINFKEESPIIETDRSEATKDTNELFRTCVNSPDQPLNTAITALTANIAGSLQTCLSSVLRTTDDETEIQFKFSITKKKVSVKRVTEDFGETLKEIEHQENPNKDNIWSTVARVVKNVFWGEQETPYISNCSHDSSSSSKRKFAEVDSDSPINHKRHKYEGRIRGRPPLSRCGSSWSHRTTVREMNEDPMNLSF